MNRGSEQSREGVENWIFGVDHWKDIGCDLYDEIYSMATINSSSSVCDSQRCRKASTHPVWKLNPFSSRTRYTSAYR
ncbi:hypothetical protein Baya_5408 [Bagarius yarrelli]|uniref:Uncharacterized protein n=1 Tax=Bagarius yarrelli TaxID=175774 RepID=A0A556TWP9_BAGYA|nr:hypothetical protein Baya_5408 [Bagarius yarrelli]